MFRYAFLLAAMLPLTGCVVHARSGPPPADWEEPDSTFGGWERLGSRMVNGKGDRDSIAVGRAEGRFSALRLRVRRSAMRMHDVVIVFGDGSTYSPPTRAVFERGSTSNVIDLPGNTRVIRRIDFRYSDLAGGGAAEVEVWGR
ncbi:MAG: hypothetical protein IPK82_42790 [Polyangiaceae bacterium]|nr:hypothetical protein [Polyangiaceae bacterium]